MNKIRPQYYDDSVVEIGDGFVVITQKIFLPVEKTTPEGQYPKLANDKDCAYPERADCNAGEFYCRCPYMKYDNSKSISDPCRWICTFKKLQNAKESPNSMH